MYGIHHTWTNDASTRDKLANYILANITLVHGKHCTTKALHKQQTEDGEVRGYILS